MSSSSFEAAPQHQQRLHLGRDDATPRICVQCVAESHADRPWLVGSYYVAKRTGSDESMWMESTHYYRDGQSIADLSGKTRQSLVGDKYVSAADYESNPSVFDRGSRGRYRLDCKVCGLTLVRKSDPVEAVFNTLIQAGVSEVSLSALAARL